MKYESSKSEESRPTPLVLNTGEWWVKVLAMLQHNWALINENIDGSVTVYFFHDRGTTKNPSGFSYRSTRQMIAVIDSLDFSSKEMAIEQLAVNRFYRMADHPGPWQGNEPKGMIFDARHTEPGIYSKEGHWNTYQ